MRIIMIAIAMALFLIACDDLTYTEQKMLADGVDLDNPNEVELWEKEDTKRFHAMQEKQKELEKLRSLRLVDASDEIIGSLLKDCKNKIKEDIKTDFGIDFIDESNPDSHIVIAGSIATQKVDARKKHLKDMNYLNGNYAVVTAFDSFSGIKRVIYKYECTFSGHTISSVRKVDSVYLN